MKSSMSTVPVPRSVRPSRIAPLLCALLLSACAGAPPQSTGPTALTQATPEQMVAAIDAANRKATLQFGEGVTREVAIRPDVDLSRYSVGNSVIIRATTTLKIITKSAS